MLLIEQSNEWLVARRYLSQESLTARELPQTELSASTVQKRSNSHKKRKRKRQRARAAREHPTVLTP
jgi:hypothetical protein